MARPVRIEYAGAVYHVMCRGDRKEPIFADDQDREIFLETLAEVCERTGFRVHSYVLMHNHYHLLLETPHPNLVAGMKWFQGTYTQRFNARHRVSGHLFQGRYKAIPVDGKAPEYFRLVSRYIHLNPSRAGLVDSTSPHLLDFRWSSFPSFVRGASLEPWLSRKRVFAAENLPDDGPRSRKLYEKLLDQLSREVFAGTPSRDSDEWKALRRGWLVGNSEFRNRLEELASSTIQGRKRRSYSRDLLDTRDRKNATTLLDCGLRTLKLTQTEARALKQRDPRKQGLAWLVKSRAVVPDEWIQNELDMGHRSNVSRAVRRYRLAADPEVARLRKLLHICTD